MVNLYPEPPHLSVSLYSENQTEEAAFAALCRAVCAAGARPTGNLETFPRSRGFNWASELTDFASELTVSQESVWPLVDGEDTQLRVAKAGFAADTAGLVVVSLESREEGDPSQHPVAASMYADQLGIPAQYWGQGDDVRAKAIATWAESLLRAACDSIAPLYAAMMVEETLPTPPALADLRSKDIFVPDRLLAADPALEPDLRSFYGADRLGRWRHGLYCAGWQSFHPDRAFQRPVAASGHFPGTRIKEAISVMVNETSAH
jgi:hypothetical protein